MTSGCIFLDVGKWSRIFWWKVITTVIALHVGTEQHLYFYIVWACHLLLYLKWSVMFFSYSAPGSMFQCVFKTTWQFSGNKGLGAVRSSTNTTHDEWKLCFLYILFVLSFSLLGGFIRFFNVYSGVCVDGFVFNRIWRLFIL